MATDRAATATSAHQGPTRGQHETGRRKTLLADLRAMVEVLGRELDRIDSRVATTTDPQATAEDPHRLPLSRPRVDRVHLESTIVPKLKRARDLVKDALADAGYDWRD